MMTSQNIAQSEHVHTGTDASHDACAHHAVEHHTVVTDGAAEQFLRSGAPRNSSVSSVSSGVTAAPRQYANNSSVLQPTSRQRRYNLRNGLWKITNNHRVQGCGRTRITETVTLRSNDDHTRVGYGGIATCGSVWACPVCTAKIAARRKTEVLRTCQYAIDNGYEVSLLTLTMRHNRGQSLAELWNALSYAWAAVTSGRPWIRFRNNAGVVGFIKSTEVTFGEQYGWHVHLHVLVISEQTVYRPVATRHSKRRGDYAYLLPKQIIGDRWAKALGRKGIESVADRGGIDWDVARDSEAAALYVAKFGAKASPAERLSSEVTLGAHKRARKENRTPWQILEDLVTYGLADDYEIWQEYEQTSSGRRAMTWSHGLRKWAGIGREQTDEEIAAEEIGDVAIAAFAPDSWCKLQPQSAELLDVLQEHGQHAAIHWLMNHSIPFDRLQ